MWDRLWSVQSYYLVDTQTPFFSNSGHVAEMLPVASVCLFFYGQINSVEIEMVAES